MRYDICLNIAAFFFLIIAMISTSSAYTEKTKQNFRFRQTLVATLLAIVLDTVGSLTINNAESISVMLNMALNAVSFMSIGFAVYSYAMYMESFFGDEVINKTAHRTVLIVFWVYVALHVVNIFGGFFFYFDENMAYCRGKLYLTIYFVPLYMFMYGVIVMVKNRKMIEKRQFAATMSLLPFAFVGALLQFAILPDHLIIMFAITLALMVIFFNIETPDFRKLQEALWEADYASRAKGDFLANMSHEIRTPMNAIVGMCELILREHDISETVQEYCFNIQNSGRSLLSIINDILDFSKIESGKMELIEEEFNISSTLNDVINMAVARKGDKNLEIIVHVDPDIPAGLIGDEIRIRQVIINIVTNAIKYTNSGCASIRVSQTKHDYGINLSVAVSDTGIGITEENLEKLFSSFQQVDTKKNRAVEGTGLGLAISKQLITKMGGFINVESEYGKGSTFRFVIPLKVSNSAPFISVKDTDRIRAAGYIDFAKFTDTRIANEYRTLITELGNDLHTKIEVFGTLGGLKNALDTAKEKYTYIFAAKEEFAENEEFFLEKMKEAEVVIVQDRAGALDVPEGVKCLFKPFYALSAAAVFNHENILTNIGERRNADTRFVAPQARVLIVDDNPINLKVAAGLMRPYHMQVLTADSAASAISMLRSKDFHIVFMDHMMPETDGIEATEIIRSMEDDYYRTLPIVALTANAVNGVKEMFIQAGMNDFIAKPIELSALDRVLKAWLPKELIKAPTNSERYAEDRRRSPRPKAEGGDDMFNPDTGVFYTGGDRDAYLEILDMYVKKGAEKREYIQKLFDERSWDNYVIEVHALKSSSLSIGSKQLSESAKELELAGKAGKYKVIEDKNEALLRMYDEVVEKGRKYLEENMPQDESAGEEEEASAQELTDIPAEKVGEHIGKIRAACEAFDGDAAAELCAELAGFSCGGKALKPLFDEVKALAEDFEYEEAAAKTDEIYEKLKNGG